MTEPVSIPPRMTQAAYARYRGVTRQAIYDLVQRGKISVEVDADGEKWIDTAAADFALGETRERIDVDAGDDDEPIEPAAELVDQAPGVAPIAAVPSQASAATARLTQAKTDTEVYRAKTAELQYHKLLGELVEVEAVAAAATDCGERVLLVIRQLSGRAETLTSAAVAGGMTAVRGALKTIEHEMLAAVAEAFRKLAADAVAGREADEISEAAE
jgi:hypothetical protein